MWPLVVFKMDPVADDVLLPKILRIGSQRVHHAELAILNPYFQQLERLASVKEGRA
jgi:hypothetical protein